MNKWINRWTIGALVAFAVLAFVLIEESHDATVPMGEVIGPDEDRVMAASIASALHMINNTRDGIISDQTNDESASTVPFRRDVHIKSHGCVKATFTVHDVERKYRWGVFRDPGTYKAWIRFSNGDYTLKPDRKWDARGMAVKLMDVGGEKLLAAQKNAPTQDFVMMNSPNYFIRDLNDYIELTEYLAKGSDLGYFLNGPSWNPFTWRLRELKLVAGTKKRAPKNIVDAQFFSASAYKLGPQHNIKFSAVPVDCADKKPPNISFKTRRSDENFLRKRLVEQLELRPACFDFMIQMQVPGKNMPVEDATIVWREKDSPFVPVARIEIPVQTFDTDEQNTFCENLSFNPWHSLPDHRPIGVFNRVRKALYEEVARYRWAENQRPDGEGAIPPTLEESQPPEPEDWCIDDSQRSCEPQLVTTTS